MTALHPISPERAEALGAVRERLKGDSGVTQRQRLLEALQQLGHVTTYEAMRALDIYDPRPRKLELVRQGYEITTTWRIGITETGDKHRIGVYTLLRSPVG